MKNIVSILIAVLALTLGAQAQTFKAQPFVKGAATVALADNTSTNLPAAVYNDVALWANTDGTTPTVNITLTALATNASGSNTFTYVFRPISVSNYVDSVRLLTVTLANTNATLRTTLSTNVPADLIRGAKALRLVSVAVSDEGGNAAAITTGAWLTGFAP